MIEQYIQGPTSVFIDASNIYHAQKTLNFRIDFLKLLEYFKKSTDLVSIFFYTAVIEGHEKQRRFLNFLEMHGFRIRQKAVKSIKDRDTDQFIYKGNLDVELTIDALDSMKDYKNFVLLSGDSDFAELLRYLKFHGKSVLVMSTKSNISKELLRQAKYLDLKKFKIIFQYIKQYPRKL